MEGRDREIEDYRNVLLLCNMQASGIRFVPAVWNGLSTMHRVPAYMHRIKLCEETGMLTAFAIFFTLLSGTAMKTRDDEESALELDKA